MSDSTDFLSQLRHLWISWPLASNLTSLASVFATLEENNRNYFIGLLNGFRDVVKKVLNTGLAHSQTWQKCRFGLLVVAHEVSTGRELERKDWNNNSNHPLTLSEHLLVAWPCLSTLHVLSYLTHIKPLKARFQWGNWLGESLSFPGSRTRLWSQPIWF